MGANARRRKNAKEYVRGLVNGQCRREPVDGTYKYPIQAYAPDSAYRQGFEEGRELLVEREARRREANA